MSPSRRRMWVVLGILIALAQVLSGCQGATTKVEIFSWWTTGGEAAGLQNLIDQFKSENPTYEVFNTVVAASPGSDARAILIPRMRGGDPPDSFQVGMGHELIDAWVKTGYMEPLDDVYSTYGLNDAFPQGVLDIVSWDGHPWSVPVDIQRANVLWYNQSILQANGIDAATLSTFAGWQAAAETLKAAGITPLALGDSSPWVAVHLFEVVAAGTLGAEKYKGLWDGTTDWTGAEVQAVLDNFKMMLSYVNADHAALSWDQANQMVIDGKAAMTIMGDWVDGDYIAKNFTGYGWASPPGTTGTFVALSDSFGLPKKARNAQAAKLFLGVLASKQGQEAFNLLKGSICARKDCDYSKFDAYLQSSAADWSKDAIVPSLAHGAATSEDWLASIADVVTAFVTNQDVAFAHAGLVQACKDAKVCP
jgi:glucose/mannose transport system substrate-binding protein